MTKHWSLIGSDPVKKEMYRPPGDHPGDTLQIFHETINRIRKGEDRPKKPRGETSPYYQTSIPRIESDIPLDQAKAKRVGPGVIKNHGKSTKRNMNEYLRVFSEMFNKKPRRQPGCNHLR